MEAKNLFKKLSISSFHFSFTIKLKALQVACYIVTFLNYLRRFSIPIPSLVFPSLVSTIAFSFQKDIILI